MTDQIPERPSCPQCGGRVSYDLACHTWPQKRDDGSEVFMSCRTCDSAIEYVCVEQYRGDRPGDASYCDWRYTHGLNPRNPRSAANEANRPPWIPEGLPVARGPLRLSTAVPGVPMIGEDDDDG